jgi:UPF0755 protein
VQNGDTLSDIARTLVKADVVASVGPFVDAAESNAAAVGIQPGVYGMRLQMSGQAALDLMLDPAARLLSRVTLPEGLTVERTLARLAEQTGKPIEELQAAAADTAALGLPAYANGSLEGFLFPATYDLRPGAPARDLVERQLAAFRENFASVNLRTARRKNLTAYDVLIIASMVEREAQLAKERPLIAAVIYNRLKDGTPLGIDATTRYVLNKPSGALRQSELEIDSPYNTRKRAGLPPTPIGNPGLASIRAAAKPASVKYRYFVVKPGTCGEHAFSETNEQFQRDSDRYNAARDAAGGKSPTTC